MSKIKEFFNKIPGKVKKIGAAIGASALAVAGTVLPASATDGNIDATMLSDVSGAFDAVKVDVMSIIGEALPVALAIMGVVLAISLGVKFFKRAAK